MLSILLIALLNLGLGFALAVYLGRRHSLPLHPLPAPPRQPDGQFAVIPPGESLSPAEETPPAP